MNKTSYLTKLHKFLLVFMLLFMYIFVAVPNAKAELDAECIGQGVADYMDSVINSASGTRHALFLTPAINMTSPYTNTINGHLTQASSWGKVAGYAGNAYNINGGTISGFVQQTRSVIGNKPLMLTEIGWHEYAVCSSGCPSREQAFANLQREVNAIKRGALGPIIGAALFNGFGTGGGTWKDFDMSADISNLCSGDCGAKSGNLSNPSSYFNSIGVNSAAYFYQGDSFYRDAAGYGMGHVVEITNGDVSSTVQGINRAHAAGIIPVVRFGTASAPPVQFAGLENAPKLGTFIKQVDSQVNGPFYVIAGANEPITECWTTPQCFEGGLEECAGSQQQQAGNVKISGRVTAARNKEAEECRSNGKSCDVSNQPIWGAVAVAYEGDITFETGFMYGQITNKVSSSPTTGNGEYAVSVYYDPANPPSQNTVFLYFSCDGLGKDLYRIDVSQGDVTGFDVRLDCDLDLHEKAYDGPSRLDFVNRDGSFSCNFDFVTDKVAPIKENLFDITVEKKDKDKGYIGTDGPPEARSLAEEGIEGFVTGPESGGCSSSPAEVAVGDVSQDGTCPHNETEAAELPLCEFYCEGGDIVIDPLGSGRNMISNNGPVTMLADPLIWQDLYAVKDPNTEVCVQDGSRIKLKDIQPPWEYLNTQQTPGGYKLGYACFPYQFLFTPGDVHTKSDGIDISHESGGSLRIANDDARNKECDNSDVSVDQGPEGCGRVEEAVGPPKGEFLAKVGYGASIFPASADAGKFAVLQKCLYVTGLGYCLQSIYGGNPASALYSLPAIVEQFGTVEKGGVLTVPPSLKAPLQGPQHFRIGYPVEEFCTCTENSNCANSELLNSFSVNHPWAAGYKFEPEGSVFFSKFKGENINFFTVILNILELLYAFFDEHQGTGRGGVCYQMGWGAPLPGSCETYTGTHECRTVCTDTLNCTHQIKDKEMPYGIDAEGNPVSDGACIGDIQVDTKVEYYRVADVGGQDMSGFHQYSTAFMTPFSSEATRDVTGRRFVDATAENEIDGNPGYGHHRNNAYNIGAEAYADVFRATTADPGYSDEPAPELLAAKNNGSIPGQGDNDGGDFELPPISTDDCFTSGFLDLFSGYSGDINPTYNSADILQRVANAQTSDGTNLTLIEVYATAAQQYGVPCELLVGIHIREGGGDPRKSVISGRLLGTPEPDQGGKVYTTLLASALDAARVLNEKAKYFAGGSIRDFSSMVTAVSKYNGGGNSNCGRGCPTFNGPCPPPSGVDDIYPMSKIDAAHDRMCLIYCADGSLCSTPVPWNNPGVLPIAYQFHQMVKGGQ